MTTSRTDPIRIVERRALDEDKFPLDRTVRNVERDLAGINKALERRGFSGIEIPRREVIAGQVSNVRAALYNESRRAKETVVDISSGPVTKGELRRWLASQGLRMNRNTYQLSVGAHIRASARLGVWEFIEATRDSADPVTHLAVVVPRSAEGSVSPSGVLQRYLGRIFTTDEWLKIGREHNRDRGNLSLVFTLGLHHNDPSQLIPITSAKLEAARVAMRRYRQRTLERIRRLRGDA